jgi:hypothetical protein
MLRIMADTERVKACHQKLGQGKKMMRTEHFASHSWRLSENYAKNNTMSYQSNFPCHSLHNFYC